MNEHEYVLEFCCCCPKEKFGLHVETYSMEVRSNYMGVVYSLDPWTETKAHRFRG